MNFRLPIFVFVIGLFVSFSPAAAHAITLSDPGSGLTVEAPAGYNLKVISPGVYKLSKGKLAATFMLANSPLDFNATVKSFVKLSKIKNSKTSKKKSGKRVTGKLKGKSVTVDFTKVGELIDIVRYSGASSGGSNRATRAQSAPHLVTLNDIVRLQRILNSRRGGIQVPLNLTVPMRRFVAPDGGSSALVPALPGWSYSGGGGVITAAHPSQGIASLGVPVIVSVPGFGGSPPISNPVGPDQAIVSVWPQYAAFISGAQIQVFSVQEVPGTAGWLGPNFLSALYSVGFLLNGQAWQALMVSGVFDTGTFLGWGWYQSYIAVPINGPGGIGAALMDTWATWDNSGAAQQRLQQALNSLLTTRVPGGPIDPEVFERAANAWSEYIRE